ARAHYSEIKIIYSIHNYFAFCPQVNLWFQDKSPCRDFAEGRKCVNCLVQPAHTIGTRGMYRLEYCLRKLGAGPHSFAYRAATQLILGLLPSMHHYLRLVWRRKDFVVKDTPIQSRVARNASKPAFILDPAEAARFAARRRIFVDALNTFADHVLAVSRRVAELTVGFGIDPAKVRTLYIGTSFAKATPNAPLRVAAKRSDSLRIAYLGYMHRDKGFFFFLRALQRMPADLARRLAVTFAVKMGDQSAHQRIKRMAHRFASVTFYDGYTHQQLPTILSTIDIAVVPVLWEDNLPQVAIECVASGVPVLTSDRGSAQELLRCPQLVFRAGSYTQLYD
ncbi:MAG: glycosyltransferase, partial [Gemmataceae bacterium]